LQRWQAYRIDPRLKSPGWANDLRTSPWQADHSPHAPAVLAPIRDRLGARAREIESRGQTSETGLQDIGLQDIGLQDIGLRGVGL